MLAGLRRRKILMDSPRMLARDDRNPVNASGYKCAHGPPRTGQRTARLDGRPRRRAHAARPAFRSAARRRTPGRRTGRASARGGSPTTSRGCARRWTSRSAAASRPCPRARPSPRGRPTSDAAGAARPAARPAGARRRRLPPARLSAQRSTTCEPGPAARREQLGEHAPVAARGLLLEAQQRGPRPVLRAPPPSASSSSGRGRDDVRAVARARLLEPPRVEVVAQVGRRAERLAVLVGDPVARRAARPAASCSCPAAATAAGSGRRSPARRPRRAARRPAARAAAARTRSSRRSPCSGS